MTLWSRRLDKRAFRKYVQKKYSDEPMPDADAFDCWNAATGTLTVLGFDNEAKVALSNANGGDDAAAELEVPWCTMDRVSYIIRRVEKSLRIPKAYWFLAGASGALQADMVACNSLKFNSPTPELILVPKTAKAAFKESMRYNSQDSTQIATLLFSLVEPLASDDDRAWSAYVKQRRLHAERLQETIAGLDDELDAEHAMLKQIRGGTSDILAGTGLSIGQVLSAESAIFPHSMDVEDNDAELQSADITTRIYSLRQPGAVDVKIHFLYNAGYHSVEWCVRVSYCIHETLPTDGAEPAWKPLLYCGLEDTDTSGRLDRWNPREVKKFGMLGADARRVRRVLFGDAEVSLADTVRLLFASVGIYIVFRIEPDGDALQTEEDIRYDPMNRDMFKWVQSTTKYSLFDARWLGVQIRRSCTAAIPSDADYVDRAAKPRYRKGDFGEDSDEDESGDGSDNDEPGDESDDDEWY